jgi:hypothetical protein
MNMVAVAAIAWFAFKRKPEPNRAARGGKVLTMARHSLNDG